jgi:hypothetical protein
VSIPYAFENKTGGVFHLEHCPGTDGIIPPILERKTGDGWKTAWALPDYACVPSRIDLVPGQIYVDTLDVYAHPFGGEREPQFSAKDVSGTYRLQIRNVWKTWIYEQRPYGEAADARLRVSNDFQLRAP